MDKKKVIKFLEEIEKISNKYKLSLSSCGCCFSMTVDESEGDVKVDYTEPDEIVDTFHEVGFYEDDN